MTTTDLTCSLVSEKIRRDKAARGVQGGRGWGPPRGHPPPAPERGGSREPARRQFQKKKRERKKKKEVERMEKNHRRRYEGKEDGIKSPAAALLGGVVTRGVV